MLESGARAGHSTHELGRQTRSYGRRGAAAPASGLLDLRGLWRVARRHVRTALVAAVLVPLVFLSVILLLPRTYTGTAVLLLDPRGTKVILTTEVLPGFGQDAAAVESQVQLMLSDGFIRSVIASKRLAKDPEIAQGGGFLSALLGGGAGKPADAVDGVPAELVQRFKEKLTVARKGLTYVVEISFKAKSPEAAARFANAVADVYLSNLAELRLSATEQATGYLSDRLAALREKARKSDAAVADFRDSHHLIEAGGNSTLIQRQLTDLTQQVTFAQSRVADAEARLRDVRAARADPSGSFPDALQSTLITNLRTQYSTLSQTVTETAHSLGDRHPNLAALRSQLAELREQIRHEIGRIEAGVRRDYETARTRLAVLELRLHELKQQSGESGRDAVELHELERQADADRAIYNQFLNRFKDTTQQEGLQVNDARLISAAAPPDRSNLPKTWILVFVAGLAGGFAAVGTILVAENLDKGIRSADAIGADVGIPCLGILPDVAPGRPIAPVPEEDAMRPFLRMFHGTRDSTAIEVLLLTSVDPDAGKSIVAAAVAAAAAASGLETLLIETAPAARAGRMAARPTPGLYDVLQGRCDLVDCLRPPPRGGHFTLGAGEPAANASVLLTGPAMADVLLRCRKAFQAVVIDGPLTGPLWVGADLAAMADCAALVVEWGKTEARTLNAAVDALAVHRGLSVVAVLNKVDLARYPLYEAMAA